MGFLLPARCGGCDRIGWVVCPPCAAALRPAPAGGPVPAGLDSCRSLLAYVGPAGALVRAVKYANNRGALRWLADGLARAAPPVDLLSWAPTSPARRRRRGYDQAELLARALAQRLDVPLRPTLRRRPGPAQTDLDRAGRLAHPGFDPAGAAAGGRRVLVVDDVTTTGATLVAAAEALRAGGAVEVHGLTAAAAPAPRAAARAAPLAATHGPSPATGPRSRPERCR